MDMAHLHHREVVIVTRRLLRFALACLALVMPATSIGATESAPAVEAPSSLVRAAASDPAATPSTSSARPADMRDPQAWVEHMRARHLTSLPNEARLIYRHGLLAHQSGRTADAHAALRAATQLDPDFLSPHLTLAAWTLLGDPSEALLHYAAALDLLRRNFGLQVEASANTLILLMQALFLGLLSAALILIAVRHRELVHGWQEALGRFANPRTAPLWAVLLLLLPFLAGFGLTLPALMALAWLWPHLRMRERGLGIALLLAVVCTPFALRVVERLGLPLHEEAAPFYGVASLENAPFRAERLKRLQQLAAEHPDNGLVQFGLGWTARRGGDLATAEKAYRAALEVWADDPRVLIDLGNVLAMQGRTDEALELYGRAAAIPGDHAAAHFNAAQLHTQRLDYARATEAIGRASAIDFELVRHYQSLTTEDGLLVLVDQWLAPERFWTTLRDARQDPGMRGSLPAGLRNHIETTGWGYSIATLALTLLSFALGQRQHRQLPLRACSNCGQVTCRRCAERRRDEALCPGCARLHAQAETPEFSRVLLLQARSRSRRHLHWVRTACATIVPGFGMIAHRRVITATVLLTASWALLRLASGASAPYAAEPRLLLSSPGLPPVVLVAGAVLIQLISLIGYFRLVAADRARESQLVAAQRGRLTQASARLSNAA